MVRSDASRRARAVARSEARGGGGVPRVLVRRVVSQGREGRGVVVGRREVCSWVGMSIFFLFLFSTWWFSSAVFGWWLVWVVVK